MKRIHKTPHERLQEHLIDAGFQVAWEDFWIQKGVYNTRLWDCACWGAHVGHNGREATLYSWDTMTLCARKGIIVKAETGSTSMPNHFEVHAQE